MRIILKTERLILRELDLIDIDDLFEMDSDAEVHRYIEKKPIKSKEELIPIIEMLKKQYSETGVGRWAIIDKNTNECLGWAGLKYFKDELNQHRKFYELGYRLKRKHWDKGIGTEISKAITHFGFKKLQLDKIYAMTDPENFASKKILDKIGFEYINTFDYEGDLTDWFEIMKKKE